jgi:transitional endoplasmic reticulum ATPase
MSTTEPTVLPSQRKKAATRVEILAAETKMISLPDGMGYDEAIRWLERQRDLEQREVDINRVVDAHPFDAAYCLGMAITDMFGFGDMRNPTMMERIFQGKAPPRIMSIPSDSKGTTVPVMWGDIQFPGINGYITTAIAVVRGRFCLRITGSIQRKFERIVAELIDLTEQYLETRSLYKGKALRVTFEDPENVTAIEDLAPEFMDLTNVTEDSIIFSKQTGDEIATNLFTPIKHTDKCRAAGIPIKRGVLLCGKYGTGKTLTANVTGALCEEHEWTFIYAKSVSQLDSALEFAKRYQPAVVFAEDLDEVVTKGRDAQVNAMLNTIDGIDNKTSDVMVVLTTNHVERINPAMLRPSRLDAVIVVEPPDQEAAVRLMRRYAKGRIAEDEDLTEAGRFLAGHIPAIIQEVVERSKLGAIYRGNRMVSGPDLLQAAATMRNQIELIKPEATDERSDIEKAAGVLAQALAASKGTQPSEPVRKPNGVTTSSQVKTDTRAPAPS